MRYNYMTSGSAIAFPPDYSMDDYITNRLNETAALPTFITGVPQRWKCSYCGSVMLKERVSCTQCGAQHW